MYIRQLISSTKQSNLFILLWATISLFIVALLFDSPAFAIHHTINQLVGNLYIDGFFSLITFAGDGAFVVVLLLLLWLRNGKAATQLTLSFVLSTLLMWLGKYYLFPGTLRPVAFFEQLHEPIRLVKGVTINRINSFPSGHATTVFSYCSSIALLIHSKTKQAMLFLFAAAVAFSRVYLSQHFLADIWVGSIIGIGSSFVLHVWIKGLVVPTILSRFTLQPKQALS